MKTLDEVIKAYEYCIDNNYRDCRGCPYGCEDGESGCHDAEEKKDALHYLKEYQKIEDEYDELKDWWAEEHAENVPLSWEELKTMEGKPVWVEADSGIAEWCLVDRFFDLENDILIGFVSRFGYIERSKNLQDVVWQAYRKERG